MQYLIALRAAATARLGRVEEALAALNEIFVQIERVGEQADLAEILRLKGELAFASNANSPSTSRLDSDLFFSLVEADRSARPTGGCATFQLGIRS
jgi:hypothetical protein